MYSNGTSEEIDMTSDMCSKVDLSSAGTKTVTVTYQGKTTTFEVVVADKKAVSMTLNGVDGKSIIEGTKLDVVGMSADITYDDGSVENVALTDDMVSYDNSKVGQSTATVKVAGLTKTFTFDVVAKTLEKIEVTTQPDKIRFFLNKTVDFSGAKITASYNNGTTEVVDVTSDMCSSVDTSTLGEKTVTVTYQGKTATFKVWIRNIITPSAYKAVVSDLKVSAFSDMVSLTFYNPDYYGGFCILIFPFMWNYFLTENRRIWKIIYGMLSAGMMFCVLKSKATASFYVLIIEVILTVIIHIRNLKRMWKRLFVYVLVMMSVIVIANVVSGGKLLKTGKNIAVNETIDEVNSSADKFQLDDIRLEDNRLRIIGPDKGLCIEVDNGTLQFTDGNGNLLDVSNSDDVIHFDNKGYSMVTITMNAYNQLVIDLGYDDTIEFYVSDNTFYGVGQNGSKITDVSRDKRWGRWLYPLFTGRGYAWANTMPMLGKTILIGHGAGTFAYYFKQNDYVGLLNTHGSTKFVIDKPHSMYLQTAMEEGCVALAAMLVIFIMVIWNYIVNYKCIESGYADNKKHNLASVAGAGFVAGVGFMIYGLVNDSMVTVNPMFWIILGICVSSVYGLKNN